MHNEPYDDSRAAGFGGSFVWNEDDSPAAAWTGDFQEDPALAGIDALVKQVEEGVRLMQKLTDRLLEVEERLTELEDHVVRAIYRNT